MEIPISEMPTITRLVREKTIVDSIACPSKSSTSAYEMMSIESSRSSFITCAMGTDVVDGTVGCACGEWTRYAAPPWPLR